MLLPVGGWPVLGAANLVVKTLFEPHDHPAYVSLLLASLEFQRAARVSEVALSIYEFEFWREHTGGASAEWLEPRHPPTREDASITALRTGDEREVGRHTSAPDSNRVIVARETDERCLAIVDRPISRESDPRRVRNPIFEADNLYDIYVFLGQSPVVSFWNDRELEPFCIYGRPR